MTTTAVEAKARMTSPALVTAEELLAYPALDKRIELVRGHVIVSEPPGMRHGECEVRIGVALSNFLSRDREMRGSDQSLGRVVIGDTGFMLARNPDTVRAPDVAYISRERCDGPLPDGFGEFAPDLAVEVRSPNDRLGSVLAKVGDWLDAGSRLVWVVDPASQQVAVYRADGSQAVLGVSDELDGGDVLQGFTFRLAELFAA